MRLRLCTDSYASANPSRIALPPQMDKLALEDEDAYLNSQWANPKALKSAFTGVGDVSWKPR